MDPKLSISAVIPAFNAESFIERAIASALNQSRTPDEIIVVDDGSTDNTAKIVKKYSGKVFYYYQTNGGEPVARNTGVRLAKGDWIAFLDADDEWLPHHLENAVKVLRKCHELKWFGSSVNHYLHESGQLIYRYREKKPGILVDNLYFEDYLKAFPPYAHFSSPTMVIHKSVFETVGEFNPEKKVGCDIDMWFRIGLLFPKIGYSHTPSANIYKRASSISHVTKKDYKKAIQSYQMAEQLAEKHGQITRRRAEPRIMYWVTKLLKSRIATGDLEAVQEILSIYSDRLSPKWSRVARIYCSAPNVFKALFRMRNIVSSKQRTTIKHGLRKA